MFLRLITAPTTEPVSLETAKQYLRVDGTEEESLILSLVKAAREKGEELARRAFITQTLEAILDEWPADQRITVWRPPLQSVTSIKYLDSANVERTWTDYVTDVRNEPGVIVLKSTPLESLLGSGAIAIRFVAGYGNAEANVPERIKNLILALTAYWYESRERVAVPSDIQEGFLAERVVWF